MKPSGWIASHSAIACLTICPTSNESWSDGTVDTSPTWHKDDRLEFSGSHTETGIGQWSPLGGPSELFLAEFNEVASRAGIALGPPAHVDPCDYFIDCLYNKLIEKGSRFAREVPFNPSLANEFGRIRRICEAATTFWLWKKINEVGGRLRATAGVEAVPDVRVVWGPFLSGGILLFQNDGTDVARNVRLHYSPDCAWTPILSPQLIPSIPPGGHFRIIDTTKDGADSEHDSWDDFLNRNTSRDERASIAEFVHSLPSKQLTMKVVFEDSRGLERTRGFRILAASWMGYTRVKVDMEAQTISTAMPASASDESASPEAMLHGDSRGPLPGIDASRPKVRQHGFPADMERHRWIAQIVGRYDKGWKDRSMRWRNDAVLKEICEALDKADVEVPKGWKKGTTRPLEGASVKGWSDALELGMKKAITDKIAYSLRMVLKP